MNKIAQFLAVSVLIGLLAVVWVAPEAEALLAWRLVTDIGPPARGDSYLAYDSIRQRAVCFGGFRSFLPLDTLADTWEWDGHRWERVMVPGPPSRTGAGSMAFDRDRGLMVLMSGISSTHGVLRDTWEYDGRIWREYPGTTPVWANAACLVYDEARQQVVHFGGGPVSGNGQETWVYDAAGWRLAATTGPSERLFPGLAYDSHRQKVVLFGGRLEDHQNNWTDFYDDTWEWDGQSWQRIYVSGPSPRNVGGMMVYHPGWRKVVLWGGAGIGYSGQIDTWTYDGFQWERLAVNSPSHRYSALWFDEVRGNVMMYGGSLFWGSGVTKETWELSDGTPVPTWTPGPTPVITTPTPYPSLTPTPTCDPSLIWIEDVPCNMSLDPCVPVVITVYDENYTGVDDTGVSVMVSDQPVSFQTSWPDPQDNTRLEVSFLPAGQYLSVNTTIAVAYSGYCGEAETRCKLSFSETGGRILAGGYLGTNLQAASGGTLQMLILGSTSQDCLAPAQARLLYRGADTGLRLDESPSAPGTYEWTLPLSGGLPRGRIALEVDMTYGTRTTGAWPYLNVR
jgi:hypothetical protein